MTDLNELHYTQLAQWAGMQRQENDASSTTNHDGTQAFVDYAYTKGETSFSFNAMREELELEHAAAKRENLNFQSVSNQVSFPFDCIETRLELYVSLMQQIR